MRIAAGIVLVLLLGSGGCIRGQADYVGSATDVDPQQADPRYWLAQEASVEVQAADFDRLWAAAEESARGRLFVLDRRDLRAGLLTTQPLVSRQVTEFWRRDAVTASDTLEATLGTTRRTVHFQFRQEITGGYVVAPKVVVERLSRVDARHRGEIDAPAAYWYALRRDQNLERALADDIRRRL